MNNENKNEFIENNNDNDDDNLGIEIPEMDDEEKGGIMNALENTFLTRIDNMAQFGEGAIDLNEVDKFLEKFPKHKDRISKILEKAKAIKNNNSQPKVG